MKLSKVSLSSLGLMSLLLISSLSWGDKIPKKQPSDYGDLDSDVKLTTPTFTTINQDGVTLGLNSVFCNSCSLPSSPTNLEYFFDISLASAAELSSLTFGPGFDVNDLSNFAVVQFDNSLDGNACEKDGLAGGAYICALPISAASLDFSTVTSVVTCAVDGTCTVNFTNFNFATLGSAQIILAATTPFGGPTSLADAVTGQPLSPSVLVNGKAASVPEPSSLWFAGIAGLICLALIARRQRMLPSATTC